MEEYERSGKIFIAYKGTEFSLNDIKTKLTYFCSPNYTVKSICRENYGVIMAKVVSSSYVSDRDPYFNSQIKVATVSGYNQDEITTAMENYYRIYNIDDPDKYHVLINKIYKDKGEMVFKELSKFMDFCSVIWDEKSKDLIAGVTDSQGVYTPLFYGFTKKNKELMFSNKQEALEEFCDDIKRMEPNTYIKEGNIYSIDGEKLNMETPLIKKTKENTDTLFDGLNAILLAVTKDAVKEKIEGNIEEYLESDDPKKRLIDYITKELDNETQKEVLKIIKKIVEEYQVEQNVSQLLKDSFNKILEEYTKTINVPVSYNVYINNQQVGKTTGAYYHEKYEQILLQTQLDEPIMLIGPAGSGKNVAISQVAESLGLHMYYTNNASNEFKLTGFIDAGGHYQETEFYRAFKNGGLFFLDEIDNSDPSALIVINSALANGYMAFPHETIDRHKDFRIVTAANTWGKGADLQYVGRNALDAATLDRFDNIFFDYDRKLEECLYPNLEILKFMWSFRDAVLATRIPHIVSTRGIGKVYKKEINGIPVKDILTSNVIKNLRQDDVNTIIGNMRDISSSNKYFKEIKSLTLKR